MGGEGEEKEEEEREVGNQMGRERVERGTYR